MVSLLVYGNIQQHYPFEQMDTTLLTEKLRHTPPQTSNARVVRKYRSRWVAHFLLWQACKTLQIDTALLDKISVTESGRPFIEKANFDFNISHSGDWVAVILSKERDVAVGVDIEFPEKTRNFNALLDYFASPDEQNWFNLQVNPADAFYRCWCLREAVLKSQGVGIIKLSEVQHQAAILHIHSAYCPKGHLLFTNELPFYLASFSSAVNWIDNRIWYWDGEQLIAQYLTNVLHYQVN